MEVARGWCRGRDKRRHREKSQAYTVTTLHERPITAGCTLEWFHWKSLPTADHRCWEEINFNSGEHAFYSTFWDFMDTKVYFCDIKVDRITAFTIFFFLIIGLVSPFIHSYVQPLISIMERNCFYQPFNYSTSSTWHCTVVWTPAVLLNVFFAHFVLLHFVYENNTLTRL